jgi:hypothetical protein
MEIGDRIRIVNYGHKLLFTKDEMRKQDRESFGKTFPIIGEDETFYYYDLRPELVGQEGEIVNKILHGTLVKYSILFDSGNRISWFSERQLEKI